MREAIGDLEAGAHGSAATRLEEYLSTGPCKDGSIGTPDLLKRRPDGTFDLGLSLFGIGEHFGRRFGEEELDAGAGDQSREQRHPQVECARRLAQAIADDQGAPVELRARARYLEGNLAFLDGAYQDAVKAYDRALVLAPGAADGGDPVGRDAAYNRAIALRRIDDQKDAGPDASPDGSADAASDASRDASRDSGEGPKDGGAAGGGPDGGDEGGRDASPPPREPDSGEDQRDAGARPPPPSSNEDDRMLDQLENAPTLQQEEAKRYGKKRVRGMADK